MIAELKKEKKHSPIAVIAVESVVDYSFVLKGMQITRKGQYNAELTLLPCLCVKLLITVTTAIKLTYLLNYFL